MTKRKLSATVSPERLRQAQELSGIDNVSEVLDQALAVFVERAWSNVGSTVGQPTCRTNSHRISRSIWPSFPGLTGQDREHRSPSG